MNSDNQIPVLHQAKKPHTLPVSVLSAGAQLFIVGVRHWSQAARQRQCVYRVLYTPYAAADCTRAVGLLDEFMCILAIAAVRTVNVRCPRGETVGEDEMKLLKVLESLQQGAAEKAQIQLAEMIRGPLNQSFRRAAQEYVDVMREAGLSMDSAPRLRLVQS